MPEYRNWTYPDLPAEISELLFENEKKLVVIGVLGRSTYEDSNKMAAFGILDTHSSLMEHEAESGNIQFYYNPTESMLFVHFETPFDDACMEKMLERSVENNTYEDFFTFNQQVRSHFARMLLFATHVCHIIVYVEVTNRLDTSLYTIFKALKVIRDRHILNFLPKLVKDTDLATCLGKSARLCTPRYLFLFENYPIGEEKTQEAVNKLEFNVEDDIYNTLRTEFIITNNSAMSFFSIPSNKRFVYYNTDPTIRKDPLLSGIEVLDILLENNNFAEDDEDLEDLSPYEGFAKPLSHCKKKKQTPTPEEKFLKDRSFMKLLKDYVQEALDTGFDDSTSKFKNKNHFELLSAKPWFELFKELHKIFIENPDNPNFECNDADYESYLESFNEIMNVDDVYFEYCCDTGLKKAYAFYNNPKLTHYSSEAHKKLTEEAVEHYHEFAIGPKAHINEEKLREMCDECWKNGKQQCEALSLRGHPCILPKHIVQDPSEHNSGNVYISVCNCGRTQGRREDPYTIRHANYEYYEYMANNCSLCMKVKKVHFAVFEPSINDFRAAAFDTLFPKLSLHDSSTETEVYLDNSKSTSSVPASDYEEQMSQPLTATQGSQINLSFTSNTHGSEQLVPPGGDHATNEEDDDDMNSTEEEESVKEMVIKVKDKETQQQEDRERNICRQPSTTEYLDSMVHTESPVSLLPQFPSWSVVCVGNSSVYSHNTGLQEHFQSGFLSGSNFLLPWDVHIKLEHSASWVASYERSRLRKMGEVFILKVFVGYEYECPRGHRFMMSTPDKVLRGSTGILRDSGSKVVYNNMPLYFPCPCRTSKNSVAQLMRVHVVTPKAPVNVIVDPKVRTGEHDYIFTLGLPNPPKLTQSAYWMLRLPYVYQGDEGPILPPQEITAENAMSFGCLLAGMFGVSETEMED